MFLYVSAGLRFFVQSVSLQMLVCRSGLANQVITATCTGRHSVRSQARLNCLFGVCWVPGTMGWSLQKSHSNYIFVMQRLVHQKSSIELTLALHKLGSGFGSHVGWCFFGLGAQADRGQEVPRCLLVVCCWPQKGRFEANADHAQGGQGKHPIVTIDIYRLYLSILSLIKSKHT